MSISVPPSIVLAVAGLTSALLILLGQNRWLLVVLLGQYTTLVWLAQGPYGPAVGGVKALGGALGVLILWLSARGTDLGISGAGDSLVDRLTFRAVASLIVLLTGFGLHRAGLFALPEVSSEAALAGIWLIASGLVQAGLFARPLRVGLGLLTFLSGFEIYYSALEPSLAVAALLAGVNLGLALIVGYLTRSETWTQERASQGDSA